VHSQETDVISTKWKYLCWDKNRLQFNHTWQTLARAHWLFTYHSVQIQVTPAPSGHRA
jgi:hypothetical protein